MIRFRPLLLSACASLVLAGSASERPHLAGEEAEAFLKRARVVDREPLEIGVTRSFRLTLTDGIHTERAVWKTINDSRPIKRFQTGLPELGFSDTYKNEIAAYELDKLLGLGMVPPTVVRRLGRTTGSLQLWIDDCITEVERFSKKIVPPDPAAFTRQVYKSRLFRQLIYDTDYKNAANVLHDPDFKIWSVDHSRAFRTRRDLLNTNYLWRFSRSLLESLRQLDRQLADDHLARWLGRGKIDALFARRDLILEHADAEVAERGEEAVLYP